jgi:hypothetical protein
VAFAFGLDDGLEVVFFRDGDFLRHDCKLTTVKQICHCRRVLLSREERRWERCGFDWRLLCLFVVFEKLPCFFEIEEVAVYLVGAGVLRDREDTIHLVTFLANCFDEKIDIYHGWKFTAGWPAWIVSGIGVWG